MEEKEELRNEMLLKMQNMYINKGDLTISEYYTQVLTFMPKGVAEALSKYDDSPALTDVRRLFD